MRLIALSGRPNELAGFAPHLHALLDQSPEPLAVLTSSTELAPPEPPATGGEIIKLDTAGNILRAAATDHAALYLPQADLYLDVRGLHPGNHKSCMDYCASSALLGRTWRSATALEAFTHVSDRKRHNPACDPSLNPNFTSGFIWCGDAARDNSSSPVCAWAFLLRHGNDCISSRSFDGLALPVSVVVRPPVSHRA